MNKKREPTRKEERSQNILIEKAQVNNPRLSEDMEKILNSIVGEIRNCPPAQARRKYQKAIDTELKMDHNTRSINQITQEILNFSDNKTTKSLRTNCTDTKETTFDKKSSENDILGKSKEREERNSDTKSNHSAQSFQNFSKEDSQNESKKTIEERKVEETNKSEVLVGIKEKSLCNGDKQTNTQLKSDEYIRKNTQIKKRPVFNVTYSKFHLGDGMVAKKIPPKAMIDLDNGDATECPKESQLSRTNQ